MSDKKKDNEKFNNPFSSLKGLSVSQPKKPEKKPDPVVVQSSDHVVPEEEEVDFFSEMNGLGVQKIDQGGLEKTAPSRGYEPSETEAADPAGPVTSGRGAGTARPRRKKQLRRGAVLPQAELDLHGVRADEVDARIGWFLENALFHGFEAVRIITGKGIRSADGPVLRPLVESYLDGPGRHSVVEWVRAPQRQGGEGAIVAFLRLEGK